MSDDDRLYRRDTLDALSAVITALWYEIDHNEGTRASAYFTPDAELRIESASFRGSAAIDELYRERASRGPRVSRHLVTNVHLVEVEGRRAETISALLLFAEDGLPPRQNMLPTLVADVCDKFEFTDGEWRIRSRWIRNLFLSSPSHLAVPIK